MKERAFNVKAHEVRAILAGTKTQTRRVVKLPSRGGIEQRDDGSYWPWMFNDSDSGPEDHWFPCPCGKQGDRLWVKETHAPMTKGYAYRADGIWNKSPNGKWLPSIFMHRAASRITLEVTGVRVERLQDISEADAVAEGCVPQPALESVWQGVNILPSGQRRSVQAFGNGDSPPEWMADPVRVDLSPLTAMTAEQVYRQLWESINGAGSWDKNPWVWVVEFKRV